MATEFPTLRAVLGASKDDMVVATDAAKADYLVTGDPRHLLPLGSYEGVKIATPREFLEPLRA